MHKKFEVNRIKIKVGYQSDTKAAPQESLKNDLTLAKALKIFLYFSKVMTYGCGICLLRYFMSESI